MAICPVCDVVWGQAWSGQLVVCATCKDTVADLMSVMKDKDKDKGSAMTYQEMEELIVERQGNVAIIKELQERADAISAQVKAAMMEMKIRKIVLGGWVPQIVVQERKTIDKLKLLEAGVTADQIASSTTVTEVVQLRVTEFTPDTAIAAITIQPLMKG
jgi:hypothetical protein